MPKAMVATITISSDAATHPCFCSIHVICPCSRSSEAGHRLPLFRQCGDET
jgi:hypothetical protein